METELFIAILSGLVTLVASLVLASYRTRLELKKALHELEENYTRQLYEKRLAAYPQLFQLLAEQNNYIERQQTSAELLVTFEKKYDAWMQNYAVYLTPQVSAAAWNFRYFLMEQIQADSESVEWKNLYWFQRTLCNFVRAELGVYDTNPAGLTDLKKPHVLRMLSRFAESKDQFRRSVNL